MKLSILVPTTIERLTHASRTMAELQRQAHQLPVEVLVLVDNRKSTIGAKRNTLMDLAQGAFISFVDDDDRIEIDYVQTLLECIDQYPDADCINFEVEVNLSGLGKKICKYDVNYSHSEDEQYYYRKPNSRVCYAKKIAVQHRYQDSNYGEDDEWGWRACQSIRNQIQINKTLYYYDYILKRPSDNRGLRDWEDHLMQQSLNRYM
ncbi:glycosyltransferase family A protein [Croceifilum oryzae]|nr:glycosyltransferase family A protein [Croceifilum oryzae]